MEPVANSRLRQLNQAAVKVSMNRALQSGRSLEQRCDLICPGPYSRAWCLDDGAKRRAGRAQQGRYTDCAFATDHADLNGGTMLCQRHQRNHRVLGKIHMRDRLERLMKHLALC